MPSPVSIRTIGSVLGDGQILETGNPRNLREVDQVFPVGKARDRVVSVVVGEYEDIIKAASDQVVVASRSSDACHVRCSSCLLLVRRLADDEAYGKCVFYVTLSCRVREHIRRPRPIFLA